MKRATAREKAILFALAAGYIDTWETAFILSRQESEADADKLKSRKSSVTHWKQHPEIQNAYSYAVTALNLRDEETARKAREEVSKKGDEATEGETGGENERPKDKRPSRLDYYDPANQRRTINAIIDKAADDPKTQLDAIKAIQQTQRDDRQAAKDNQIQRFYTPVTCKNCPFKAQKGKK